MLCNVKYKLLPRLDIEITVSSVSETTPSSHINILCNLDMTVLDICNIQSTTD